MFGGRPPCPKSVVVLTMPRPKWCCQMRLAMTRTVSGWSGLANQRASASRRPLDLPCTGGTITGEAGVITDRKPGCTSSPGVPELPRIKICVGCDPPSRTANAQSIGPAVWLRSSSISACNFRFSFRSAAFSRSSSGLIFCLASASRLSMAARSPSGTKPGELSPVAPPLKGRMFLKNAEHAVIIRVRNRVELVIVATRTTDRHAEKRRAGGDHGVVQCVEFGHACIVGFVVPHP